VTFNFTHNASSQAIAQDRTTANSGYVWPQPANNTQSSTANGLNQIAQLSGANFTYDGRGNLTSTGAASYSYDVYNRLTGAGSATLAYDPAGRLYQTVGGGVTTRFQYDGVDLIAEYNSSNALQRRYVHGPGIDEPIIWYEGSGTGDRRWLHQDRLGSVVASSDSAGALIASPNTYDEYGVPGSSNDGRFQYTGQTWLPEASLYYYKARAYAPSIGRFLQSDPILLAGGVNLYIYAGNDPTNAKDPSGLCDTPTQDGGGTPCEEPDIIIMGVRILTPGEANSLLSFYGNGPATPGANTSVGTILVENSLDRRQQDGCPTDPQVTAFLREMQAVATALNDISLASGRNHEFGSALGFGPGGNLLSSPGTFGIGAVELPHERSRFQTTYGSVALYDWHTHVTPGVNGASLGFTVLLRGGGDVLSTALATDPFAGSFIVMPGSVRFLSRGAAIRAERSGAGTQEGVPCW
jgi:RHS repeat-associated protein